MRVLGVGWGEIVYRLLGFVRSKLRYWLCGAFWYSFYRRKNLGVAPTLGELAIYPFIQTPTLITLPFIERALCVCCDEVMSSSYLHSFNVSRWSNEQTSANLLNFKMLSPSPKY